MLFIIVVHDSSSRHLCVIPWSLFWYMLCLFPPACRVAPIVLSSYRSPLLSVNQASGKSWRPSAEARWASFPPPATTATLVHWLPRRGPSLPANRLPHAPVRTNYLRYDRHDGGVAALGRRRLTLRGDLLVSPNVRVANPNSPRYLFDRASPPPRAPARTGD